ncbi:hypothetical protein QYF36_000385 [Acer negundo]|nr:hypothetical protein QYF36_000385 [Acer negundo]
MTMEEDQAAKTNIAGNYGRKGGFRACIWLDRAAIVSKDTEPENWKVCTVTQVEEVKILIRMLPILGSTVIMETCSPQLQTLSVQQGNAMDPKLANWYKYKPENPDAAAASKSSQQQPKSASNSSAVILESKEDKVPESSN